MINSRRQVFFVWIAFRASNQFGGGGKCEKYNICWTKMYHLKYHLKRNKSEMIKDATHITRNDRPFACPIIYMDTIHITINNRPFACPIIYTDTKSQCYFVNRYCHIAWHSNAHSLMGIPYFTIIASNGVRACNFWFDIIICEKYKVLYVCLSILHTWRWLAVGAMTSSSVKNVITNPDEIGDATSSYKNELFVSLSLEVLGVASNL